MIRMEARPPAISAVGWLGRTLRSEVWVGIEPLYVVVGWFRDRETCDRWEVIAVGVSPEAAARAGNRALADRGESCEANAIVSVDGVIPEDGGEWMFQGAVGSCTSYEDVQDTLPQPRSGFALPDFDALRRAIDACLSATFAAELNIIAPHAAGTYQQSRQAARRSMIDPPRN